MEVPDLRVKSIRAVPLMVPLNYVLGTSAGAVRSAPLLLFDLETHEADLTAVRAARNHIPDNVAVMVDYNQALSVPEATRRGRASDGEDVYWIEEPVRHDDYAGCARIKRAIEMVRKFAAN